MQQIIQNAKYHGKPILKPTYVRIWHGGISMQWIFKNGYQASVVQFEGSYGYEQHKWELAILKKDNKGLYRICYHTGLTEDVIGHLSLIEVQKLLFKISKLKFKKCDDKWR